MKRYTVTITPKQVGYQCGVVTYSITAKDRSKAISYAWDTYRFEDALPRNMVRVTARVATDEIRDY